MLEADRIEALDAWVCGHWIFLRVTTESGRVGFGESTYFVHPTAIPPIVEDLTALYRGESPYRPEYLYQRVLKKHCMIDAASASAVSAIDQALWDVKAKALGVPVWELLGGRVRDRVRAILLIEAASTEEMVDRARAARDEGFSALKLKPFIDNWSVQPVTAALRGVVERITAVREAVGWDVDLAVEVHRNLAPDQAIRLGQLCEPLMLYFIEDPVQPFSLAVNQHVASGLHSTVALAERNTNIWEFRDFSDNPAVSILRPDAGLAGGFTQLRKIAAIAESRHQRILPHNFTSPLITAAHVQLAAAIHNWDVQGYVREQRAPWSKVVTSINAIEDGFLLIPEVPGIGIELNMDYITRHGYEPYGDKFNHIAFAAADGGVRLQ